MPHKQKRLDKAVRARVLSVLVFVEDCRYTLFLAHRFEFPPAFTSLQTIDTLAPLVILCQYWGVCDETKSPKFYRGSLSPHRQWERLLSRAHCAG